MRASKEGAKEVPVAAKAEPAKKPAPAKKSKAAKAKKATKKAAKPVAAKARTSDSFQAAQRVWPD